MEYSYFGSELVRQTYFVRECCEDPWIEFGYTNYSYDEFNNLIEESNNSGVRIIYEYEKGLGNANLIYCEPDEAIEPVPVITKRK